MDDGIAVRMALQEMNPGHGRQALEIVHAETHGTIHQAVDREAMLLRIDLGEVGGVLLHEVKLGRSDDSPVVLKRGVERDVINTHSRPSARGDPSAQVFAGDVFAGDVGGGGIFGLYFGLGCLASRPFSASASASGHTSQRTTSVLQEPPPARSFGIHERLP